MSKIKKVFLMATAYVLVAALAIGGTIAYLTDTDSDVNVMTMGNVSIVQNEQNRSGADFKQGQTMLPIVTPANVKDSNGYPACENYIDKIVTVSNIGKTAAYIRTFIAIPVYTYENQPEDNASANVIHWNGYSYGDTSDRYPAATRIPGTNTDVANNWYWGQEGKGAWPGNGGDWNNFEATIYGQKYEVYVVTNLVAVAPGETTAPNMIGIYLDSRVDFDGEDYTYEGKKIEGFDGTVKVLVATQAVQADGWDNAWTALDSAFDTVGAENHPWINSIPADAKKVDDLAELKATLTSGGNILIDAPIIVNENLTVSADSVLYATDKDNVLTFENNAKITVNKDTSLELYGVQMDAEGTYSFDKDGNIEYDADARRTTPLLNAGAGSTLIVGNGTTIENVVAKGSAVLSVTGADDNRAKVVLEGATIQNCAGESGTIINVNKASDVFIEDGTVISNNASYNNNNHGIIRVYNAWDAANPSMVTMNGGQISGNYYSGNGMIGLYYGKFIMNDGDICDNSWFADNQKYNGWYPVIYAHSNSQFVMNGGGIYNNTVKYGVINSLNSSLEGALTIHGGTITNNIATNNNNKDACAVVISEEKNSLIVSDEAQVTGTVWVYYDANENYFGQYTAISEYLSK